MGTARRTLAFDPVGVVGAITPWNVPFYLNVAESTPALMASNTVVLKPAQLTPWSGAELGRIVAEETDIPRGLQCRGVQCQRGGRGLSADPRVDMITFTGSTATGRVNVPCRRAPTVKGHDGTRRQSPAHIVLDDAKFEKCLPIAAMVAADVRPGVHHSASRILLPHSRYDEGIDILKTAGGYSVGDPLGSGVLRGPPISGPARRSSGSSVQAASTRAPGWSPAAAFPPVRRPDTSPADAAGRRRSGQPGRPGEIFRTGADRHPLRHR